MCYPWPSWTWRLMPEGYLLWTSPTSDIFHIPCPSTADYLQICNIGKDPVFPGTALPDCSFLASDIQECQAKGKIVTLSIGGADGAVGFASNSQATEFADTIWDIFLGGSSSTRPFGSAILDG